MDNDPSARGHREGSISSRNWDWKRRHSAYLIPYLPRAARVGTCAVGRFLFDAATDGGSFMSANRPLTHPRDEIIATMERIYSYRMTTTSGGNISIRDEAGDVW